MISVKERYRAKRSDTKREEVIKSVKGVHLTRNLECATFQKCISTGRLLILLILSLSTGRIFC